MEISLPLKKDGGSEVVDSAGHPLVIIGANGAGKSRFTSQLISSLGEKAYSLSALHGLYVRDGETVGNSSVGRICNPIDGVASVSGVGQPNELDLLLWQLMHDEMLNLLSYKLSKAGGENVSLHRTRLDRVVELWQEIFPGNKILVESGSFLFSRANVDDRYSAQGNRIKF